MAITIRPYEEGDLAACRELWRELTERHREIYEDASIGGEDPGLAFDDYLARPELAGPWLAVAGAKVVGLAGLLVREGEAEIEPVVVRSDQRSRGVGTALIEFLIEEAKRRRVPYLSVRPVARNARAMACFHRAGFSVLGHVEMFQMLDSERSGNWKAGIKIHGLDFEH